VLLHNAGRDALAAADRDALVVRPRPDIAAALTARRGTGCVLSQGCQLLAERPGIVLVQIDLVRGAADLEPHRLRCRAAVKIVFKRDRYHRCHRRAH